MIFSPEKQPLPPSTVEEDPKKETPEDAMETAERMPKSLKAMIAISGALLWGEYKLLNRMLGEPRLPGGELKKEDEKKVQEKGWILTMAEKAQDYYQTIGKVEDVVEAFHTDKWDELLGESPEQKQETK